MWKMVNLLFIDIHLIYINILIIINIESKNLCVLFFTFLHYK